MNVNLRSLIGKLNQQTRNAVEAAAGLCLSRTHYDVEIEHFLLKLLDGTDNDFSAILRHYEIDRSRLARDIATFEVPEQNKPERRPWMAVGAAVIALPAAASLLARRLRPQR